jgi:hypothetical protein
MIDNTLAEGRSASASRLAGPLAGSLAASLVLALAVPARAAEAVPAAPQADRKSVV